MSTYGQHGRNNLGQGVEGGTASPQNFKDGVTVPPPKIRDPVSDSHVISDFVPPKFWSDPPEFCRSPQFKFIHPPLLVFGVCCYKCGNVRKIFGANLKNNWKLVHAYTRDRDNTHFGAPLSCAPGRRPALPPLVMPLNASVYCGLW